MKGKIAVVGHPSRVGGADTELHMQIEIWQALGVEVHLCHTGPLDKNCRDLKLDERGCIYHAEKDWASLKDMHVISYCNSKYLENLHIIKPLAASTTFVNCMTWVFDKQKVAAAKKLIDYELYQTKRVMKKNTPELLTLNPDVQSFLIKPYFNSKFFSFIKDRPRDKFRFGRIHREDAGKFHPKTLWIYDTMVSPSLKDGLILGFNKRIQKKIGTVPNWIKTYHAGGLSQDEFYKHAQAIIQPCDPKHTENLPRIGFEAMASGSILIVDNKGGWQDIVKHGKTGWLCNDERDFVYYSSRCAYEHKEREKMALQARERLEENWGIDAAKDGWAKFFMHIGVL